MPGGTNGPARQVILLRHAQANAGAEGGDRARALSKAGEAEALAAGHWLARTIPPPTRVLCSPALRTRQTLERVMAQVGPLPVVMDDALYEASTHTLLQRINAHADTDAGRLLVVAHNPGLSYLATWLAGVPQELHTAAIRVFGKTEANVWELRDQWQP